MKSQLTVLEAMEKNYNGDSQSLLLTSSSAPNSREKPSSSGQNSGLITRVSTANTSSSHNSSGKSFKSGGTSNSRASSARLDENDEDEENKEEEIIEQIDPIAKLVQEITETYEETIKNVKADQKKEIEDIGAYREKVIVKWNTKLKSVERLRNQHSTQKLVRRHERITQLALSMQKPKEMKSVETTAYIIGTKFSDILEKERIEAEEARQRQELLERSERELRLKYELETKKKMEEEAQKKNAEMAKKAKRAASPKVLSKKKKKKKNFSIVPSTTNLSI